MTLPERDSASVRLQCVLRLICSACVVGLASCTPHLSSPNLAIPGDPPLRYVTVGDGPALVVVLHGGPGLTHDYLRPEWDRLRSIGQVVYYDQRGCGANPGDGDVTWQAHVADLDRLIRRLSKGRKVFLAGSSWGAELALRYAYAHPKSIDALVLSGFVGWPAPEGVAREVTRPPLRLPNLGRVRPSTALGLGIVSQGDSGQFRVRVGNPGWVDFDSAGRSKGAGHIRSNLFNVQMLPSDSADLQARIDAYVRRKVEEFGAVIIRQAPGPGEHSKRAYAMQPSSLGGDSALAWRFPMNCYESALKTGLSRRGPPLAALASIQTPTLAISGGPGRMPDGSSQLVGVLPEVTVRSIAGGGHDPWYSQADIFFSIVTDFLGSHLTSRRGP